MRELLPSCWVSEQTQTCWQNSLPYLKSSVKYELTAGHSKQYLTAVFPSVVWSSSHQWHMWSFRDRSELFCCFYWVGWSCAFNKYDWCLFLRQKTSRWNRKWKSAQSIMWWLMQSFMLMELVCQWCKILYLVEFTFLIIQLISYHLAQFKVHKTCCLAASRKTWSMKVRRTSGW